MVLGVAGYNNLYNNNNKKATAGLQKTNPTTNIEKSNFLWPKPNKT